jgi:hypothetical protein
MKIRGLYYYRNGKLINNLLAIKFQHLEAILSQFYIPSVLQTDFVELCLELFKRYYHQKNVRICYVSRFRYTYLKV